MAGYYVYRGSQPDTGDWPEEPEEPPRRRGRPPAPLVHGSWLDYMRERNRGLEHCQPCRDAWAERVRDPKYLAARRKANRAYRARKKQAKAA